jgi:excinuclease UvrABC ATPase subunit
MNGKSIAEVLEMTVEQALEFFQLKVVVRKLQALRDVWLNYNTLGSTAQHALGRGMPAP